jgi:putative endopeptidase
MDTLVDDLFKAYRARIQTLDWMGPETKRKALKKLTLMGRKIGHPRRFRTYAGLVVKSDDYFGNMVRASEYGHRRALRKLKKPVDRAEWFMAPQVVNAYCNFNMNEIVFHAAILQPPFFDLMADDAFNYGAIGSVIGHEITHGFDDQGSKFDGAGNMKSWWSKNDRARFEREATRLAKQYDTYKVADGVSVNGKLTLGENIADLGGLSIAFDAYRRHMAHTGAKTLHGFTPEERFFLGAARAECTLSRPEFQKFQVLNDPHSPAEFRVNGPLTNLDSFHETYGLSPKDKLYKKPSDRIRIW